MRNLFICHTQAHLLLASGLAKGRFKKDENILILFVDFGIKDELKQVLNSTFNRTLYLQSIYPAEYNTIKSKLKWYPQDWKQIKSFLTNPVDRTFAVCDWLLLVQKTLQRAYRLNPKTEFAWMEDGITAYYSDSNFHLGLDKNKLTMTLRRVIFRDILCTGKFYDRDFEQTGGLKFLKRIYTCYPEAVREPYKSQKRLIQITDEEYFLGLQSLYPKVHLDIKPNTVILVVDKLDRYMYPDKVKKSIIAFIRDCKNAGKSVVCKFHPRESEVWDVFDGCEQLDKSIGIESAYVSLADIKDSIIIAGIKSAGLMSAKKIGYATVSLFPSCGESNDNLIKFYRKLGIKLL